MKKIILLMIVLYMKVFSLGITPDGFEKRIDGKGGYKEITISGSATERSKFRIYVVPGLKNPDKDMSKWVEFYPKILTVPAGEQGIVKLFAKAPTGTEQGEYTFMLGVQTLPSVEGEEEVQAIKPGVSLGLDVNLEMYGFVGFDPQGFISQVGVVEENKELFLKGKVKNTSPNRTLRFRFSIETGKKEVQTYFGKRVVPEEEKEFKILLDSKIFKSKGDVKKVVLMEEFNYKVLEEKKL